MKVIKLFSRSGYASLQKVFKKFILMRIMQESIK